MEQLKPLCRPHDGSHPQQHQQPSRCLQIIEAHSVTHMCAAPVILNMLVNTQRSNPLRNPVNILIGGAPPPSSVLLWADKFTARSKGYGFSLQSSTLLPAPLDPIRKRIPYLHHI
ncbi:hypothetical protein ACFX13_025166 [Malus domestica]